MMTMPTATTTQSSLLTCSCQGSRSNHILDLRDMPFKRVRRRESRRRKGLHVSFDSSCSNPSTSYTTTTSSNISTSTITTAASDLFTHQHHLSPLHQKDSNTHHSSKCTAVTTTTTAPESNISRTRRRKEIVNPPPPPRSHSNLVFLLFSSSSSPFSSPMLFISMCMMTLLLVINNGNVSEGLLLRSGSPLASHQRNRVPADIGDNVLLSCDFEFPEGIPVPYVVQWQKLDNKIPIYIWYDGYPPHTSEEYEGRASLSGRSSLNLTNIRDSDHGWYECKIFFLNRPPAETPENGTWILLDVQTPPQFKVKPPDVVYVKTGESLSLPCQALGTPSPAVLWYKVCLYG